MSDTTPPADSGTPTPNTTDTGSGQGTENTPTPPVGEGATGNTPPAGSDPTPTPPVGDGNQQPNPVEVERLKRENQRLRGERNTARTEAEELKRSQMTDEEKARHDSDAAQAALATANQRLVSAAVLAEAARLGFADPSDAVALVNTGTVAIGDDGVVSGVAEAVKVLAESKPHLVKTSSGNAGNVFQPAGGNTAQPREESREDRILRLKLGNRRPVAGKPRISFDRQRIVGQSSDTPPLQGE